MRAVDAGSATGMLANYLDRVVYLVPGAISLPISVGRKERASDDEPLAIPTGFTR